MTLINSFFLLVLFSASSFAQKGTISGRVLSEGVPIPFAAVYIDKTQIGTSSNHEGEYSIGGINPGQIILKAQAVGFVSVAQKINVDPGNAINIDFNLKEDVLGLEEIVFSGTRTDKRRIDSAIPVNVLDAEVFSWSQSSTLVDGLNFIPGVRTEIDCQTCNYSQIRINGLGGAYSQILINSRPIFSSLQGLYGLEQIPSAMVERIEVIRGGGSAIYGSNAIAGIVNVITKIPTQSMYEISMNHSLVDRQANDNFINANIATINTTGNAGAVIFASRRSRQHYDANEDGYSELPELRNNTFGLTSFYKFSDRSKLELNVNSIYEYRRGGNKFNGPAHLSDQSEERIHNILSGGLNMEHVFTKKSSMSFYFAGQGTTRGHYTGIIPEIVSNDSSNYLQHFLNPPYGSTKNTSYQGGFQYNHKLNLLFGENRLTTGVEYLNDKILDEIEAYDNYLIDQDTREAGVFVQSDWDLTNTLTLLSGARISSHNFVSRTKISPRASLLYKAFTGMQVRASYSSGFRAPQAFDADLHMAFASGAVSRIQIDPDLKEELSHSFSGSVDYNRSSHDYIYGFTVDGFYTRLLSAFILEELGETTAGGRILEKRNGGLSTVSGVSFEVRGNYKALVQLETGVSFQRSMHELPVEWSSEIEGSVQYLRTPNVYGFYVLSYMPVTGLNVSLSGVLTGSMLVPHYGGAPGIDGDRLYRSPTFFDNNIKFEYPLLLRNLKQSLRIFAGAKNIFNHYQQDFDIGKNRDSNYVYGPAAPRSLFLGIKIGSE